MTIKIRIRLLKFFFIFLTFLLDFILTLIYYTQVL